MGSSRPKRSTSSSEVNTSSTTTAMDAALATLQPLRDLARNWDVDVASCLEEYLQELAGIHPQQLQNIAERASSGTTDSDVPNFAHAALILQNSSNVYSRKVEYLYALVYKALEEFFQASKNSSSSSNRKSVRKIKGVDADVQDFFDFDPNECFLLLDDVVPEDLTPTHRKINLKEEEEDSKDLRNQPNSLGGADGAPGSANNRTQNTNNNVTRLSLGGLSVTRMERNNTSGYGGVSSQQQQRALLGILNNGSLRLMSGHCDIRDDGVLLMPGSQPSRRSSSRDSTVNIDNNISDGFLVESGCKNNGSTTGNDFDTDPRNLFEDADDHDEGPGFVMNDDFDDHDNNDMDAMDVDVGQVGVVTLAQSQTPSTKRVAFADSVEDDLERKQNMEENLERKQKKVKKDPWQLLDPHSIGDPSYTLKPLKRGKTIRLPEGLFQPPSECVTGSSTSFTAQPERRSLTPAILRPSLAIETFRVAVGKQLQPSSTISFRGLAYGDEFLYIAKENAKLKAAKRREERKREQESRTLAERRKIEQQTGGKINDNFNEDDDYGDGDDGGGFDFGGSGDTDYDDCDHDGAVGNSGLVNLEDAFGNGNIENRDGSEVEDSNFGKTFEEICRSHIQAFAKSAEKFALTTKLTDRISQWQAHLSPILEEEERKASFDIHQYSEMFLETAIEVRKESRRKSKEGFNDKYENSTTNPDIVEFKSVAEGCTRSDICRFFLTSLSLANSGNVKIEQGSLDYRFEVLSGKVDNPMETYQAPSVNAVGDL